MANWCVTAQSYIKSDVSEYPQTQHDARPGPMLVDFALRAAKPSSLELVPHKTV